MSVTLLTGFLSACAEDNPGELHKQPGETITAAQDSAKPSFSAAQLASDASGSVQSAMAVAAGEDPITIPGIAEALVVASESDSSSVDGSTSETISGSTPQTEAEPELQPASPNNTVEPTASKGEASSSDNTGETNENELEPPGPPSETSSTELTDIDSEPDSTDQMQAAENSENSPSESVESQAGDTESSSDSNDSESDQTNSATADNEISEATDSSPATESGDTSTDIAISQSTFVSSTTAGFEGEVLEDSIRIRWQSDAGARGYNVYRQGEYIDTVFTPEYIDENVYDDNYYYEIQAFDFDDEFFYIATGLTVTAQSFGRTDPDAAAANDELLQDYELVFSDEFNGPSLDTSKWNTAFLWGPELFINSEEQYYVDVINEPNFGFNPFSFDGDFLTINSIETPPELSEQALQQPYLSGIITSYDAFKFTYGYVEARARFTHGRGYWPAFWLLNAYYVDAKPEIDIMEFIGHNQDVVYHTYHYFDNEGNLRSTESMPTKGIDFTADFHTFGVEWLPGVLIFYVDGIERHRVVDANVSSQEMYVIANTAIGGWWAGSPDANTPFPGEYVLDYIRVYQKTTPYESTVLDDGQSNIPLNSNNPGRTLPNHRPSKAQWPEGYPDGL